MVPLGKWQRLYENEDSTKAWEQTKRCWNLALLLEDTQFMAVTQMDTQFMAVVLRIGFEKFHFALG